MEKHQNQNGDEIEDEEDLGIKFNELLDHARKFVEEKNNRLAEFYVTLANLEPKCDIQSKIKSIGIYTFVRNSCKDPQIMDHLVFKIDKYLKTHDQKFFDFNLIFCMIRVLYRGALVKNNDYENATCLYLLRKAKILFEDERIENEESSRKTISNLFNEIVEKFKREISQAKEIAYQNKHTLEKLKSILKRENLNEPTDSPAGNESQYYLISANWVNVALPFIEEFIKKNTQTKDEEFFNINNIFSKCVTLMEKQKIKINSLVYPGYINNHDILAYKDYWFDYHPEYSHTNVFLSKTVRENQDFFYLSDSDWLLLKNIFGCFNEIPRKVSRENNKMIDTHLIKLKILVLNKHLRENAVDYIRPRYVQLSKFDKVKDLKEKIIRCLSDLFKCKLKNENHPEYEFNEVNLYSILFGIKKRKREILKLIYSYTTDIKKFNISCNKIDNDETTIDDLEYGPGDLIIAEVDGGYIQLLGMEKICNYCSDKIINNVVYCESCKNNFYCSISCKKKDLEHSNYHSRLNKFSIKKFKLFDLLDTKLEEILDSSHTRFGKVGLRNLGNTCFMNSALQCLSHCEDLTKFFLLKYHLNDINSKSNYGSGGQIANSYYDLINNLWNSNCDYLSPGEFRHMLVKIVKKFQGFSQQDSHELLTYLLDSLHEDMNRNITKPYIEMKEQESHETDDQASKRWWNNHLKRENSIIVDLFHGQYKSTITCPECNRISITYDPFMYLGLPIPSNQNKFYLKYFPNLLKESELKYYELEIPLVSNKAITGKDIKIFIHQRFGEKDKFNSGIDYQKILRWYDIVVLTSDKIFKRVIKNEEEILGVIEKEGEIIIYEKYSHIEQFNENYDNVIYIDPIFLKEESSMIFFNKMTRNSLYYPLLLTVNLKSDIKNIFLEIFKIFRKVIRDIKHTDIHKFMENLKNKNLNFIKKEFEIYFKPEKYDKIDFESPDIPFDLFFLNTISEPTGFFSTKPNCEFCDVKKCEYCRVLSSLDLNQPIINIFNKLKNPRPICILVNFKSIAQNKLYINDTFPFNIEELANKPLMHKSDRITLQDCLNLFRSEERLEKENSWYCCSCKKHQEASKKMEIFKAPNILIIQLKRFRIKSTNSIIGMIKNGKNESVVYYPLEGLNFKDYIVGSSSNETYDLFAISQHFGSLSSGHYTALCKNKNKWYEFDDESVNSFEERKVVNNAAYLLFYRKRHNSN